MRPPRIHNLPPSTLLHVCHPLYGITDTGRHGLCTYHGHHRDTFHFTASLHDPCFMYTPRAISDDLQAFEVARGFTCLQTDDMVTARKLCLRQAGSLLTDPFRWQGPTNAERRRHFHLQRPRNPPVRRCVPGYPTQPPPEAGKYHRKYCEQVRLCRPTCTWCLCRGSEPA